LQDQDLASITDAVVERIRIDAEFASLIADQLGLPGGAALRTVEEIIANDEDYSVEFKSTVR
jgi:type I restriction enzyme, R subunit